MGLPTDLIQQKESVIKLKTHSSRNYSMWKMGKEQAEHLELWPNFKKTNRCVIGVSEASLWTENVLEEIMSQSLLNLMNTFNSINF